MRGRKGCAKEEHDELKSKLKRNFPRQFIQLEGHDSFTNFKKVLLDLCQLFHGLSADESIVVVELLPCFLQQFLFLHLCCFPGANVDCRNHRIEDDDKCPEAPHLAATWWVFFKSLPSTASKYTRRPVLCCLDRTEEKGRKDGGHENPGDGGGKRSELGEQTDLYHYHHCHQQSHIFGEIQVSCKDEGEPVDQRREVESRPLTSLDAATKVAGDCPRVLAESAVLLATRASANRLTKGASFLEAEALKSFPGVV